MYRRLLLLTMTVVGCGRTGLPNGEAADASVPADARVDDMSFESPRDMHGRDMMRHHRDLAFGLDLAAPRDLSWPVDLSIAADLSAPFDFAMGRDLAEVPDLSHGPRTLSFGPPTTFLGTPNPAYTGIGTRFMSICSGDFDGDGRQDVAAGDDWWTAIHVFRGDGQGALTETQTVLNHEAEEIRAVDLNGDGILDLIALDTIAVNTWLNQGSGTFGQAAVYSHRQPGSIIASSHFGLADLNDDGNVDVVTPTGDATATAPFGVHLGNADGSFGPAATYPAFAPLTSTAAGDINGDGYADGVLVYEGNCTSTGSIVVALGNGTGALAPAEQYATVTGCPMQAIVVDIDGDGRNDLVVTSAWAGLAVLYGNGTGLDSPVYFAAAAHGYVHIASVADFDLDGRLDIATVDTAAGTLAVYLGHAGRQFAAPVTFPVGVQPVAMAAADLNGDGLPDLVFALVGPGGSATSPPGGIAVLLNTSQ